MSQDEKKKDRHELRGRLLSTIKPEWWPRIKEFYKGNDLKLCKAKNAPDSGTFCGNEKKTCFFETQKCPNIGVYPNKRCTCNGSRHINGKWACTPAKCPTKQAKISRPSPAPTRSPKGTFVSSPGRAFKVKMNLLSSKVLEGYDNVKDLKADLYQVVRFYVNALIEEQSIYRFWSRPVAKENIPSLSAAGATDFETNNQEKGVDESDLVKSDGKFVYAAYGDGCCLECGVWETYYHPHPPTYKRIYSNGSSNNFFILCQEARWHASHLL
jgi:Beta propeller domain